MQNTQMDRRARNTQLDRRVQHNQLEPRPSASGLSRLVEGPAAWLTSFLLIPALIAVILLLPPINLWDRLQLFAFTRINTSGGVLSDPDGTLVSFPPEGVHETFYATFDSVPRIDFIEGQAGRVLYEAAENLPDHLIAKSPIYSINLRGAAPTQSIVELPVPNDSMPYETLGLYSWNGTTWTHVPSRVVESDVIEARLDYVPTNFMVMQTSPDIAEVTANLVNGANLPEGVRVASEIRHVATLRGDGALTGEMPADAQGSLLLLTNVEDGNPRTDLINNLLLDPGRQDNQLNEVVNYVTQSNFRGVVVDYQDVDPLPSARADFVYLIKRMADRLHASNKEITVRVATPVQISAEEWSTDGYDWVALSQVVNKLMVPAPVDPRAYRPNGEMDAMLSWATSMVERRKLQIELPVQSVETVGNYIFVLGFEEAFEPLLGQVSAQTGADENITVSLDNPQLTSLLQKDAEVGAFYYTYRDAQDVERTVYIEDAGSISHKLTLLNKYNITDVALQPPNTTDIDQNIWSVLLQFQIGGTLTAAANEEASIAYTVYDTEGNVVTSNVRPLSEPQFSFQSALGLDQLQIATQLVGARGQALSQAFASQIAANAKAAVESFAVTDGDVEAAAEASEEIAIVESRSALPRINATTIVNVRTGPGTNFDVLGQVLPENSYQAMSRDGDWWEIDIGGNETGWIIDEFVAQNDETALAVAVVDDDVEIAAAAADATVATEAVAASAPSFPSVSASQIVNLRGGPGTNYPVMGQVNPGSNYRILGKNEVGDWWQIEMTDGQTAWIIDQLVNASGDIGSIAVAETIPEPPAPQPEPEPAVEAPNEQPAAQAPAAPAPVSAPTAGLPFGYGVQAHMVHTGMEGQVMAMTTGMGFNWVKQQIEWKVFEANQGQIGFGDMDLIINAANGAGVSLLFSVVNAPAWARESGFDGSVGGPPADPNTFANFLGQIAGKYCNTSLKAIEVWNEQNLHYEWGNKPLNAGEYVNLLAASYNAIKGACPSMTVVSGALTPAGNNGNLAMDDFTYLEQMFQAGANNYLDAVGSHPSGYNVPPWANAETACAEIQKFGNSFNGACDSPHHSWSFQSTMLGYRNIMNVYGAGNKKIIPTEFGWAAGGAFDSRYAYANDNDFNEQAEWTVQAYQMMRDWGWVGPAFLWNLNFRVVADGTEKAQWGIVSNDWSPLPIYNALASMPK